MVNSNRSHFTDCLIFVDHFFPNKELSANITLEEGASDKTYLSIFKDPLSTDSTPKVSVLETDKDGKSKNVSIDNADKVERIVYSVVSLCFQDKDFWLTSLNPQNLYRCNLELAIALTEEGKEYCCYKDIHFTKRFGVIKFFKKPLGSKKGVGWMKELSFAIDSIYITHSKLVHSFKRKHLNTGYSIFVSGLQNRVDKKLRESKSLSCLLQMFSIAVVSDVLRYPYRVFTRCDEDIVKHLCESPFLFILHSYSLDNSIHLFNKREDVKENSILFVNRFFELLNQGYRLIWSRDGLFIPVMSRFFKDRNILTLSEKEFYLNFGHLMVSIVLIDYLAVPPYWDSLHFSLYLVCSMAYINLGYSEHISDDFIDFTMELSGSKIDFATTFADRKFKPVCDDKTYCRMYAEVVYYIAKGSLRFVDKLSSTVLLDKKSLEYSSLLNEAVKDVQDSLFSYLSSPLNSVGKISEKCRMDINLKIRRLSQRLFTKL